MELNSLIKNKKVLAFDLDDTLSISKGKISRRMAMLLNKLSNKYYILIITGGKFEQIKKQVLDFIDKKQLSKFISMPTCGAMCYIYRNNKYKCIYKNLLPKELKKEIINEIKISAHKFGIWPKKSYGQIIEDRFAQITFSALGQLASVHLKNEWKNKYFLQKAKMQKYLAKKFKKLDVKLGGSTSIDITEKGIDKAYGIKQLLNIFSKNFNDGLAKKQILFFGDAIYKNGNDYSVKLYGIDCINVKDFKDTKKLLNKFQVYLTHHKFI